MSVLSPKPTVDLAIIGSGISGSAFAASAQAAGADYVVLEAGIDMGRDHIGASIGTQALAEPTQDNCFQPFLQNSTVYGKNAGYRVRVGGRGLYWRGICLRLEDEALAEWPESVRQALVGSSLSTGYYTAVEHDIQRWMGGTSIIDPRTATERSMAHALNSAGYLAAPTPRAIRFGDKGTWAAYTPLHAVDFRKVMPSQQLESVHPLPGNKYQLIIAGEAGRSALITKRVALCAGTFNNARIIDRLRRQSIARENTGHCYRILDHVATGMVRYEQRHTAELRDSSVFAGHHPAAKSNLFVEQQPMSTGALLDIWAMGEQTPSAASTLTFCDDVGGVRLDNNARNALDSVFRAQRRLVYQTADVLSIRLGEISSPLDFGNALNLATENPGVGYVYQATLGELDHECGGLALAGEVVTKTGELDGFPGLVVAGPCLFPRAGAANPTLTTLALTRYVARSIGIQ